MERGAMERGADMAAPVVARLGEAESARALVCLTGVNPVRMDCSAFRRRGGVGWVGI